MSGGGGDGGDEGGVGQEDGEDDTAVRLLELFRTQKGRIDAREEERRTFQVRQLEAPLGHVSVEMKAAKTTDLHYSEEVPAVLYSSPYCYDISVHAAEVPGASTEFHLDSNCVRLSLVKSNGEVAFNPDFSPTLSGKTIFNLHQVDAKLGAVSRFKFHTTSYRQGRCKFQLMVSITDPVGKLLADLRSPSFTLYAKKFSGHDGKRPASKRESNSSARSRKAAGAKDDSSAGANEEPPTGSRRPIEWVMSGKEGGFLCKPTSSQQSGFFQQGPYFTDQFLQSMHQQHQQQQQRMHDWWRLSASSSSSSPLSSTATPLSSLPPHQGALVHPLQWGGEPSFLQRCSQRFQEQRRRVLQALGSREPSAFFAEESDSGSGSDSPPRKRQHSGPPPPPPPLPTDATGEESSPQLPPPSGSSSSSSSQQQLPLPSMQRPKLDREQLLFLSFELLDADERAVLVALGTQPPRGYLQQQQQQQHSEGMPTSGEGHRGGGENGTHKERAGDGGHGDPVEAAERGRE